MYYLLFFIFSYYTLGSSWSSDENYFVFVAKRKEPETSSRFGSDAVKSITGGSVSSYEFVDDWGEKYEGTSSLVLVIVSVAEGRARIVTGIDENVYTVGQPIFVPIESGESQRRYRLAYTAWKIGDRRLGMIYCYHRSCSIFTVEVTDLLTNTATDAPVLSHTCVSSTLSLARSPRVFNNAIVFIGREKRLITHNGCMELYAFNLSDNSLERLVDSVENAIDGKFPGIFADQLPRNCVTPDGQIIFCSSYGSKDVVMMLNPATKALSLFSDSILASLNAINASKDNLVEGWNNLLSSSFSIVEMNKNWLILNLSSPNAPSKLVLYDFDTKLAYPQVQSVSASVSFSASLDSLSSYEEKINNITWKTFTYSRESIPMEFILMLPSKDASNVPLIVVPHGGPHSSFSASFLASYAFLCAYLNAAVVLINYRGSTGFGQAGIDSLVANVGKVDVDDCMFSVQKCLELVVDDVCKDCTSGQKIVNPLKIGVVGGSHGGFLSAHLIGQYPEVFKAACMRNPVTNIPAMTTTSDIPDWCWVEATGVYDFDAFLPTPPEISLKMYESSPIRYLSQVKTPTLICLGLKDRRVPPSQGIEYFHFLRSKGVPCKLLTFPEDCHAIDKPKTEAEHWFEIAYWLRVYLNE